MHHQRQAAIICNDLDSLVHRIETLPAHPRYTDALLAVQAAKQAIAEGSADLHHQDTAQRHGGKAAPQYKPKAA